MSNRPLEQKRSSLDFSESSSEQDESRRGGYANKDGLTESYNSQEPPYSPDMNTTDKITPKSILKDNAISASKASKNIYINETLNETHPIAQKSVDSNLSPDQNEYSYKKNTDYQDKYRSGESSLSSKSGEYQSPGKYGSDEDDGYGAKLSSKYTNSSYGQGVSGFKNRLVVGDSSQGPTDFQRAHVRKLQQEREQDLYSKAVRESADAVREKWLLEKAKRNLDADDLRDDKAYSQSHSKGHAATVDDTGARFEKIKNQVRDLEQNLNSYSKSVTKSEIKQKDRSQNLGKVYGQFEESLREAKEELEQSLNNKHGATLERSRGYQSRGFSAGKNSRGNSSDVKAKSGKTKTGHASSVTRSINKGSSIEKGTTLGRTKAPSKTFLKLQDEISRLQRQNEVLRERLGDDEENERARRTIQPGPDIDREKDLIDTIERIKKKLRHNISEKMHVEKKEEIQEIQEEAAAKSFGRNYTTLGTSYKDILMRKTYGGTVSSKENSFGRISASKTYGRTSYSQKLNQSKR